MKHGIILLATALLICSCKNSEDTIYPVVGNQYHYINDDEVDYKTGTPDELDGKRLIANNFSFDSSKQVQAIFWTHDLYKTSDSTVGSITNFRIIYYQYEQIGNDVFVHNDSCSFIIKSKINCIIYNDTVYTLSNPIEIEIGDTIVTDEP